MPHTWSKSCSFSHMPPWPLDHLQISLSHISSLPLVGFGRSSMIWVPCWGLEGLGSRSRTPMEGEAAGPKLETLRLRDGRAGDGRPPAPDISAAVSSPVTRQKAAAAKQIIENHFRNHLQGLQDRRNRWDSLPVFCGSGCGCFWYLKNLLRCVLLNIWLMRITYWIWCWIWCHFSSGLIR